MKLKEIDPVEEDHFCLSDLCLTYITTNLLFLHSTNSLKINKQKQTHKKKKLDLPCQYLNTSFLFCFQCFPSASSIKICKLIPGIAAQTT